MILSYGANKDLHGNSHDPTAQNASTECSGFHMQIRILLFKKAARLTTNGPCDYASVTYALNLCNSSFCTHPSLIYSFHTCTPSTRLSDHKTFRHPPFRPVQPGRRQLWRSSCFDPLLSHSYSFNSTIRANMPAYSSPLTDTLPPEVRIRIYREVLRANWPLAIARRESAGAFRYMSSRLTWPGGFTFLLLLLRGRKCAG